MHRDFKISKMLKSWKSPENPLNALPKCYKYCVCVCVCADVRLDQPQQGAVPAEPHGDRPGVPARRGAADAAQPLRHELHGSRCNVLS